MELLPSIVSHWSPGFCKSNILKWDHCMGYGISQFQCFLNEFSGDVLLLCVPKVQMDQRTGTAN